MRKKKEDAPLIVVPAAPEAPAVRLKEPPPIYHRVEQRSAAWYRLRIGKPTASDFDRVFTPGGKASEQADGYARSILAEMMLGKPIEAPETAWMVRGQELEDSAIEAYEFQTSTATEPGGFVTNAGGTFGCSPDRLVGDRGMIEMKVPAPNTHIGYLLDPATLQSGKKSQVQGELLVTQRDWCDLVSFHPELPTVIVRVRRDEHYINGLRIALNKFVEHLAELRAKLESQYGPFPSLEARAQEPEADDSMGVSDEDVTAIWEASQK